MEHSNIPSPLPPAITTHLNTLRFLNESTDDYLFLWEFKTDRLYFAKDVALRYKLPQKKDFCYTLAEWGTVVYPHDLSGLWNSLAKVKQGKTTLYNAEYRLIDHDGSKVWVSCKGTSQNDENGQPMLLIGRISELLLSQQVDLLTGLPNAEKFSLDMESFLGGQAHGYLMLLGIDNFKNVNLKYGRNYGNLILKALTTVLEENVSLPLHIYRMDGDRFALNLTGYSKNDVEVLYNTVKRKMAASCTVSAGVAFYLENSTEDCNLLYQYAETALEHAKNSGKNKMTFFSMEDYEKRLSVLDLQDELEASEKNGCSGFYLCYQPQVDAQTYKLHGAEALLRYHSPSRGRIFPDEFVPILESSELICSVGLWVLKTALDQCREWRKIVPGFHISVNMSYVQLKKETIFQKVLDILRKSGLPGDALTLEITESMQLQDYNYYNKIFNQWKKFGINISIDDFGTGYSNLSYLKSLEIGEVKIDRCFVSQIQHSAYNQRLLNNIIELAHISQIIVCCEGIETEDELGILKALHADLLQGYLFSKPCEAERFEELYIKDTPAHRERTQREAHYCEVAGRQQTDLADLSGSSDLASIVENLEEVVYICDTASYELYYMNPAGCQMTGISDYHGMKCYKVLQGMSDPCPFCTNHELQAGSFNVWEVDNTFLHRHFMIRDKLIPWNNNQVRMGILIDITEREHVTQSIKEKLRFEQNILTSSQLLMQESDLERAVTEVLHSVCDFYRGNRAFLFTPDQNGILWNSSYEWRSEKLLPKEKTTCRMLLAKTIRRWTDILQSDSSVIIGNTDSLQSTYPEEWKILHRYGVRRLLLSPIRNERALTGFIGVDNPRHRYGDDTMIFTMSRFLGERLAKEQAKERLHELLECRYKDILTSTKLGLFVFHISGHREHNKMFADSNMRLLLGLEEVLSPEECYQHWYDRINDDYYRYVQLGFDNMIRSNRPIELIYNWEHPTQGTITIQCIGVRSKDVEGVVCLEGYYRILSEQDHPKFLPDTVKSEMFSYSEDKHTIFFHTDREMILGDKIMEKDFPESWISEGIVHPSYADEFRAVFSNVRERPDVNDFELLLLTKNRSYEWFRLKTSHKILRQTEPQVLSVLLNPINRERLLELEYLRKNDFYHALLSETIAFAELDIESDLLKNSGGLWGSLIIECKKQNLRFSEFIKGYIENVVHPDDIEICLHCFSIDTLRRLYREKKYTTKITYRRRYNDNVRWVELVIHLFKEKLTGSLYSLLYLRDIDLKKKEDMERQYAANIDELTKIFNRRAFENEVMNYLTASEDGGMLLLLDLDDFKSINDNHGHLTGDAALRFFADTLRLTFSASNELIGRMGGDEFLVFLKGEVRRSELDRRIEQFRALLKNGWKLPLACSIGLAPTDGSTPSFVKCLQQADIALYYSKHHQKGISCYYDKLSSDAAPPEKIAFFQK